MLPIPDDAIRRRRRELRAFSRRPRERGVALLAVFWTLVLLSVIAASLARTGRGEARLAAAQASAAQARALAEAGVEIAILRLHEPDATLRWRPGGEPRRLALAGGAVEIRISGERGRIDLNAADGALLAQLFQAAGVDAPAANALADAVQDYRDADGLRRLNGAERREYEGAGHPGPADAPFAGIDELRRVLGVDPALFDRVAPALTVHSGAPSPSLAVAPELVLRAASGVDAALAETILANRARQAADVPRAGVFRISVEATAPDGAAARRDAIVEIADGAPPKLYGFPAR